MSLVTEKVAKYVSEKGINLSKMSRETAIPYSVLYASLQDKARQRDLRDDEFIAVCRFLDKDPRDFA